MPEQITCDGDDCTEKPVFYHVDGNFCSDCMEAHDPGFFEQVKDYNL